MKKMCLVITITIFIFISCDINFLPLNKYDDSCANYFSATGVIRGTSIDFFTNNAHPDFPVPGVFSVIGDIEDIGGGVSIRLNYDFITANTTYTNTEMDGSSQIHFQIESNLIFESEGYRESDAATGTLEIFNLDGNILTGSYDVVTAIGDTLSGDFQVHIPTPPF